MSKTIILKKVLREMRQWDKKGDPIKFDIVVREFNKQNKLGGRLRTYKRVSLVMMSKGKKRMPSIENLKQKDKVVKRKRPHHFENRTRNIKLSDGSIKKINILLIIEFNKQKVIY